MSPGNTNDWNWIDIRSTRVQPGVAFVHTGHGEIPCRSGVRGFPNGVLDARKNKAVDGGFQSDTKGFCTLKSAG